MTKPTGVAGAGGSAAGNPWTALLALCVGFFMILVDMTIVAVAQPAIAEDLHTDLNGVVWVSSAYLLTYAVPLLVAGRLGDKYGPKLIYQIGLVVFTAASLWCGLSGSIGMLIAARAVQGIGAALITPQTMAVITRIFPPEKRGAAMGVWGSVAGVATLVGPLLGGVLTDNFSWEWIFFVNIPVGIIGLGLAAFLVPSVDTHDHQFDWVGVTLSAIGLTALVFGIQEGEKNNWDLWIWALIIVGAIFMVLFVVWQGKMKGEPLVPLSLFRDRNFSIANVGITSMGFAISGLMIPVMFYLQLVGGMSPTQSALMMMPMALISGFLAPIVGRILDKVHPRNIIAGALLLEGVAVGWAGAIMTPETPVWQLLLPMGVMGFAQAGIWAPLAATATRNLPWQQAGAGAGVYNTTRMIGSVIGAAAVGVLMQALLTSKLGAGAGDSSGDVGAALPQFVKPGFAEAMGHSLYLPAVILLIGGAVALFFERPRTHAPAPTQATPGSLAKAVD
ncbi:putative drug resistance transporter [Gordonia effusa NBRC 100432]|uniref:Putative drug resistance transporter n=1 Tax=Gordonia effusa NBRC 100432 TaxID=1077974 RepID=H0QVS5_9ACTN|nr:MFS transporter [Gordonia effusa]GAB16926.1 putative drug resistance transporter [Gordonia effusa NBRC 100432]